MQNCTITKFNLTIMVRVMVVLTEWWKQCSRIRTVRQHPVQPLQGTMQVHLDPAWSSGHSLPVILRPPPLYKAESYHTHPGQLVHSIAVSVHGLSQPVRKVSTIEHQHTTTPWDFAHSCGVSTIATVSTCTLHKDTVLAKGLDIAITFVKRTPLPMLRLAASIASVL